MALCPYHLLRTRVNGGLSNIPRHRLRIGRLYQAKTNLVPARTYAVHAPHSDPVALNNDASAPNDHESPGPTNRDSTNFSSDKRLPSQDLTRPPPQRVSRFDLRNGRGIEVDGVPMVYTDTMDPDSEEPRPMQALDLDVIETENRIRGKSLFRDPNEYWDWREDFWLMRRVKDRELGPDHLPPRCLDLHEDDYGLFEKLTLDGPQGFRSAWEKLTKESKADRWPHMSLYLLYNTPDLAWVFLYVTCQSADRPMLRMAFSSLGYLRRRHARQIMPESGISGITFQDMVHAVLDPEHWPVIYTPQLGLRLFIKYASPEELHRALDIIRERKTNVKAATWLCFMKRFTYLDDIDTALEVLSQLSERDLRDPDFLHHVQNHCAYLLLKDFVSDNADGRNFYILPRMLEIIPPNVRMMNVVMNNASKTGDTQLADDVVDYMRAEGIRLDDYSYMQILRDAISRGDKQRVEQLSHEINHRPDLRMSPHIAGKLLYARYIFMVKNPVDGMKPEMLFESMLEFYNHMFDLEPLKALSIIPRDYTPTDPGLNHRPSVVALFLMIATYIRHFPSLPTVIRVYTKFRSLAWEGHPAIAPMQASHHIYNEFLAAFRRHPDGLQPAVRLVQEMIHGSEQSQSRPPNADPRRPFIVRAKPTVQTWNILLSIFVFQKHPLAVEKVKEMMKRHNVEFDTVTWNTIINGYVHDQNLSAVARSVKKMEEEGHAMNERTLNALSYFRDPERLWNAVKALDDIEQEKLSVAETAETVESVEKMGTAETMETTDMAETDELLEDENDQDRDEQDFLMMRGLERLKRKQ